MTMKNDSKMTMLIKFQIKNNRKFRWFFASAVDAGGDQGLIPPAQIIGWI